MRITKIIREVNLENQTNCAGGQCPGLILTEDGNILIQGNLVAPGDRRAVQVPDHEDLVQIPRAVFENLIEQYRDV